MTSTVRVLLIGAGKRVSLAMALRSAAQSIGIEIDMFAYESTSDVPISSEASIILGKRFNDPSCGDHLRSVCDSENVDIAIACHDAAVRFLPELPAGVFAPACSPDLIEIFGSKRLSASYFRSLGMSVPPAADGPPAIAKPDFGSSSKGLVFLRSTDDFARFMAVEEVGSFEVQKQLSGPEFTVDAYKSTVSGRTYSAQRIRLETSGGEVVRTATVNENEISREMDLLLNRPGVEGPLTAQFIWDESESRFFIMEVNARFGGGMPASVAAGCPLIEAMFDDFLGRPSRSDVALRNVTVARSFREHVFENTSSYRWRDHE